jgi:hypothetical protein
VLSLDDTELQILMRAAVPIPPPHRDQCAHLQMN